MVLEIAIVVAVFVYLIITYLQHLRTQKFLVDLAVVVGYNITFLSKKYEDYGKPPKEKQ